MINGKRIVVVMPAYNAEKTLAATVRELPDVVDHIILVDDHSTDETAALARQLGLTVAVHESNRGYGANQKTCMPRYKYFSNRALTFFQNFLLGAKLSEYHTGFRAYTRQLLLALPMQYNSEDFVFDNQVIAEALFMRASIGEISCPTRYFPEASSINLRRSIVYGWGVVWTTLLALFAKWGLLRSPLFDPARRLGSTSAAGANSGPSG